MKGFKNIIIGFVIVNIIWYLASLLLATNVLQSPFVIYSNLDKLPEELGMHIISSLKRVGAALSIALAIGVPTGIFMGRSRILNKLLDPVIYFLYPIPKTALLPVAMLLMGLGDSSKIFLMILTMVFQIILAVRDASKNIDTAFYDIAVSSNLSKGYVLKNITLPAIIPELFTAIRISTGTAIAILFVVEAYGTRSGIGYYILDAWSRISYIEMYGGIVVVSLVGALLFLLIDLLEMLLSPWNKLS